MLTTTTVNALTIQWLLMAADQTRDLLSRAGFARREWRKQPYWVRRGLAWCYGGFTVEGDDGYVIYRMGAPFLYRSDRFCLPPYLGTSCFWTAERTAVDECVAPLVEYEQEVCQGSFLRRRVLLARYQFPRDWQSAWWVEIVGRMLPDLGELTMPRWETIPALRPS